MDSDRTDVVVELPGPAAGDCSVETVDSEFPDVVCELSEGTVDSG